MKKIYKRIPALLLSILMLLFSFDASAASYVMTYGFAGTSVIYKNNIAKTGDLLNNFSPSCFDLNADGTLRTHSIYKDLFEELHAKGVSVTPFLSNHWDRPSGNAALNNIEALTDQLKNAVIAYNLDGINVDIQNVNEAYRARYTLFVKRLKEKLPGKTISVAVAANPYGWTTGWHGSYDYKELALNSDYLMIMAYDESYYGSAAGPVASSNFVEKSIQYALKYTTPEKIVLGVPFFGRYWKSDGSAKGIGITMSDVEYLLENSPAAVKTYDTASQSARVEVTLTEPFKMWGGSTLSAGSYTIWYDDLQSLKYKINLINQYELKGLGSWALGQEDPDFWPMCADTLNNLSFKDINGHWAESSIMACYDKGWMVGNNRLFRPGSNITRAEIAVILVRICNLQNGDKSADFSDTANHWARNEIAIARNNGLIQGVGENRYNPNAYMTREQLAVLLDRTMVLSNAVNMNENPFRDLTKTGHEWSYHSIIKLYGNGILTGYPDGTFRPLARVTRAETAATLERISGFGTAVGSISNPISSVDGNDEAIQPVR